MAAAAIAAVGNIVLARSLGARALGAYAVASFVLAIVALFAELGVYNSVIRHPGSPDGPFLRTAFTLTTLLLALAAPLVLLVVAPAAAAWYGDEDLRVLLSLGFLGVAITSLLRISQALLEKDMAYSDVVAFEALATLGFYVPAAALALAGLGVAALGFGEICRGLAAFYCYRKRPFRVALGLDGKAARELLRFGTGYIGMTLTWMSTAALNPVVVGKIAGLEAAGVLRVAEGLVNHLTLFRKTGDRLAYPVLARLQEDRARVVQAVEDGRIFQFLLGLPPLFAFTALSPWLVPLLYGERFGPVATVLPLVSLGTSVTVVFGLYSSALVTIGRNADVLRFHLVFAAALWTLSPVLVSAKGLLGLPLAIVLATPAFALVHGPFVAHFGTIRYRAIAGLVVPSWGITVAAWWIGRPLWSAALFLAGHAALLAMHRPARKVVRGVWAGVRPWVGTGEAG